MVHHPIDYSIGWAEQGILDVEAAAAVVESLGADTFNANALALASQDDQPVAVPADGWGQLLCTAPICSRPPVWRRRTRSRTSMAAAEALHADGMSGITRRPTRPTCSPSRRSSSSPSAPAAT